MNKEIKLFHYPILRKAELPAYEKAFLAFHEMLRKGHTTMADVPDPEQPVLVARIGGELVGLVAFTQDEQVIYVDVAWVSPKHRRKGVWTTMWNGLIGEVAEWYGFNRVYWSASSKNKPMLLALDSLKVKRDFITYVHNVKESK